MKYFKILLSVIIFVLAGFLTVTPVSAVYAPTSVSNNKFGVHVVDTSNLSEVAKLTNSNGGDWGYVTFVIQKGERNPERWQSAFDDMRRLHLVPIVRIATAPIAGNNNVWGKPSTDEIDGWVSFLNSLNWVIKNRYVIIGNEPNHASEWGGEIDPKGYADYLKIFSQKLKNANENFFIMPAGLDASANNSYSTMEESLYLSKMFEEDQSVFQYVDGLSSHSYPNPAFSGPGDATGKGTVRTYDWELSYLKFLGLKKDLPVFITETGWIHNSDLSTDIGPKIETAFKNVWEKDNRVVAVTPFIFKYIDPPFDTFSWQNKDGLFYDFYYNVINLSKVAGTPIQEYKANIVTEIFPKISTMNSIYNGILVIKNTGQSMWMRDSIKITTDKMESIDISSLLPEKVEPNQIGVFLVTGRFPNVPGNYNLNIELVHGSEVFNKQFSNTTNIIPAFPTLSEVIDYIKNAVIRRLQTL